MLSSVSCRRLLLSRGSRPSASRCRGACRGCESGLKDLEGLGHVVRVSCRTFFSLAVADPPGSRCRGVCCGCESGLKDLRSSRGTKGLMVCEKRLRSGRGAWSRSQ